ncbi:hypothetical protein MLD38_023537 [Melastoma candidum]|uniref:Uncharacterized protein n=1 Tax=Melastoma candidum TaxID=119954 RepID=A0ACB9NQG7_9MYRT|nr:hypothetical protein MLD38_023537 [Melastoma candidum]
MRVKEIPCHPLCCISTLPSTQSHFDPTPLPPDQPTLLPSSSPHSVAGSLHKWTNYGKGWQWRWFCLRDALLYYSKLRRPHCAGRLLIGEGDDGVTLIGSDPGVPSLGIKNGDHGIHSNNRGRFSIVQLKASSFRESKSDDRRFYIFTATKTLHLRAKSNRDRTAWIQALVSARGLLSSRSLDSNCSPVPSDVSISTDSLKERLVREGVCEDVVRECERIMLSEFSEVKGQLRLLCEQRSYLLDALSTLEASNVEAEAPAIHGNGHILTKHDFSGLGLGKYCEYSAAESSDDIEKQEAEDSSEEDEIYFFDTEENFPEPAAICGVLARDENESNGPHNDVNEMDVKKNDCGTTDPSTGRRTKLPDPLEKEKGVNLWSLIKDCVGKDLTRVCLPVYFNEPVSSLQKCFEEFEYSFLLDQAYAHGKSGNSLMRTLYVAAFAVSGYASSKGRPCKPFNPLLGETYEADYPEKGVRFISEKVSHHPTLFACQCEGRGWTFWGDSNIKTKFWGQSIQLNPVGQLNLQFDDGETFTWSKVTTSINNLILGKVYCDHHGTMQIRGNREYSCSLKFKDPSIFDWHSREVHGFVEDANGRRAATVFGKWDEAMYCVIGEEGPSKIKGGKVPSSATLLWESNKPPPNLTRYNLTSFAITLNELTPGLQEKLPPTDSRLRPDQRHLENGEYEKANFEKQRLEKRQRMSAKIEDSGWKPRWFRREGEGGQFRYIGGYWESREQSRWEGCTPIFGEFGDAEVGDEYDAEARGH